MKQVGIDIYNKLTTLSNNVFLDQLPDNIDSNQLYIVYEYNIADSSNTLDRKNFENSVDVRVKILSKNAGELYDMGDSITDEILEPTPNYQACILVNSVPLFWDERLQMNQHTLLFNMVKSNTGFNTNLRTEVIIGETSTLILNFENQEIVNEELTAEVAEYNLIVNVV